MHHCRSHAGESGPASGARSRAARWLNAAVVGLALAVLAYHLHSLDLRAFASTLRDFPPQALIVAAALSLSSYLAYCGFDLLGRRYTRHRLSTPRVLAAGLMSHAFALNLGPAGVGFRFRTYHRLGIRPGVVARLWVVCMVSNWLGLSLLAGLALSFDLGGARAALPPLGSLHEQAALALGAGLLAWVLAYLGACGLSRRRRWRLFGQAVHLPSLRFAAAQTAVSTLQWLLVAAMLFVLFQRNVPFATMLAVLLLSALALAVVDVPGGVGVTEAVFIALLGGHLGVATIVVALLGYRLVYFLVPLLIAGLAFLRLEWRGATPMEPVG